MLTQITSTYIFHPILYQYCIQPLVPISRIHTRLYHSYLPLSTFLCDFNRQYFDSYSKSYYLLHFLTQRVVPIQVFINYPPAPSWNWFYILLLIPGWGSMLVSISVLIRDSYFNPFVKLVLEILLKLIKSAHTRLVMAM